MDVVIKEQDVEIVSFEEFLQENYKRALEFKDAFLEENKERLKDKDEAEAIYSSYQVQQTRKEGKYVSYGMFRKHIRFQKNEDDSYTLQYDGAEYKFFHDQSLFILSNGIAIPINIHHKDFLIKRK